MRTFRCAVCTLWVLGLFFSGSAQVFNIEIITSVNTAPEILFVNDTLVAATDGGMLLYRISDAQETRLTVKNGFFSQQLTALALSPHDLLVTGSLTGVISFLNLSTLQVENDLSLSGEPILDLAVAGDTLWVLTRKMVSVYRYEPTSRVYRFIDFYNNFQQSFEQFTSLAVTHGRVWVGTPRGILTAPSDYIRFNLKDAGQWTLLDAADGLPEGTVSRLAADDSHLYLATTQGLVTYNFQQFSAHKQGLLSNQLNNVRVLQGQVFVNDEHNIYRFDGQQFQLVAQFPRFRLLDVAVSRAGELWASTDQRGILNVSGGKHIRFDGPLTNFIGPLLVDSQGRLWCGSSTQDVQRSTGLFMYDGEKWTNFKFFGPLLWSNLSATISLEEDAEGNIWVGSWEGGLVVIDREMTLFPINRNSEPGNVWISSPSRDDTLQLITPEAVRQLFAQTLGARPQSAVVTDIFFDEVHQSIWTVNWNASSGRPLLRFPFPAFSSAALDASNWISYSIPLTMIAAGDLRGYTRDVFDILWLATGKDGALRFQLQDDGALAWDKVTQSEDNLKSNQTLSIAADQDGYVWIGTLEGLSAFLNGTVFDFREDFQPIGLKINDIFVDSNNNKWFATDKGLSLLKGSGSPFDPANWFHMVARGSELNGPNIFHVDLPAEAVNSVLVNPQTSDVILGTPGGIAIIYSNPFASTFNDYSNLRLGPNPFRIRGEPGEAFTLFNLTPGSTVRVLSASGHLVRELRPGNRNEVLGNQAKWDGRNVEGKLVSSGVYLLLVLDPQGRRTTAKVLVINESDRL